MLFRHCPEYSQNFELCFNLPRYHLILCYSGTSRYGLSEIGTTFIQWINSKALIDSLQELISVSMKLAPPNSDQVTKAGASSSKSSEDEFLKRDKSYATAIL